MCGRSYFIGCVRMLTGSDSRPMVNSGISLSSDAALNMGKYMPWQKDGHVFMHESTGQLECSDGLFTDAALPTKRNSQFFNVISFRFLIEAFKIEFVFFFVL